jgi:hypothetical protein
MSDFLVTEPLLKGLDIFHLTDHVVFPQKLNFFVPGIVTNTITIFSFKKVFRRLIQLSLYIYLQKRTIPCKTSQELTIHQTIDLVELLLLSRFLFINANLLSIFFRSESYKSNYEEKTFGYN